MVLVLQEHKILELGVMEVSTRILKEDQGGPAARPAVESLQASVR